MSFIIPYGLELQDWADSIVATLGSDNGVPRLESPDDWQSWGASVMSADPRFQYTVADPYAFDDWREWAVSLIDAL